jgi:hypothetical protein
LDWCGVGAVRTRAGVVVGHSVGLVGRTPSLPSGRCREVEDVDTVDKTSETAVFRLGFGAFFWWWQRIVACFLGRSGCRLWLGVLGLVAS